MEHQEHGTYKFSLHCTMKREEVERGVYLIAGKKKQEFREHVRDGLLGDRIVKRIMAVLLAVAFGATGIAMACNEFWSVCQVICGISLALAVAFLLFLSHMAKRLVEPERSFQKLTPERYCRERLNSGNVRDIADLYAFTVLYINESIRALKKEDVHFLSMNGKDLILHLYGTNENGEPLQVTLPDVAVRQGDDEILLQISAKGTPLSIPKDAMDALLSGKDIYPAGNGKEECHVANTEA